MLTIDKRKAKTLLRGVVKENGRDTRISGGGCYYRDVPGNPVCIVGKALHKALGSQEFRNLFSVRYTDSEALWSSDFICNGDVIESVAVQNRLRERGIHLTPGALKVFTMAQVVQDGRSGTDGFTYTSDVSWGNALDRALAV